MMWRIILPMAVALPLLLTVGVALVSERLSHTGGLLHVQPMGEDNATYWIVFLGVLVFASGAAYAQASVGRGPAGELYRRALPSALADVLGRWLWWGGVAAVSLWLSTLVVLLVLPWVSPEVYGSVDLFSTVSARLVWSVPVWAALACGAGVGLGAMIGRPSSAVALLLLWALLVENSVALLPGGARILPWMPFLNGVWATGQSVALTPAWGRTGALIYVFVITAGLVFLGVLRERSRRRGKTP
ncbi:hypothetical protein L1O03_08005 [Corynebacterium uropygiale]|uniref:ABC transporter permease n=1 Tax=Corynebacterium uropygiale TaxID=1775911 RepID=A0A9X1TYB5_9CORY|nr:hypothetical protein [Corynebacterium uropygiale]MCF4007115.1 hypothetical protein [Corynebacterium uropygiale]